MGISENKGGRPAKNGKRPFTEIFCQLISGETQQAAADKIGVSRQNIGKWLSGSTTPDIETLCRIADAYNVPTDYLLGRTPNKTIDIELQAVCEYTGLSEDAINLIKIFNGDISIFFNLICGSPEFWGIITCLFKYYKSCELLIKSSQELENFDGFDIKDIEELHARKSFEAFLTNLEIKAREKGVESNGKHNPS